MSEIWDIPFPFKLGVPKPPFFGRLRNLTATLTAYLWNEARYGQSVKCVDNYRGSPTSSQNVVNFGVQTASNPTCILPTLRKSCILLHCQASQTEISKRNLTKLCQVMG